MLAPFTASAEANRDAAADNTRLMAYTVITSAKTADRLRREHFDISAVRGRDGKSLELEIIMTAADAARLLEQGIEVSLNPGQAGGQQLRSLQRSTAAPVFRTYGGVDGLQQEIRELAEQYPKITELETIGQSVQGVDILALKVTKKSRHWKWRHKRKPAVLYVSMQHAREWITTEVNRRLLLHFLENYGNDRKITWLLNTTELWFVLVANPDGYDYTFTPGNRLWRKNLADNDGDGQITSVDGVDPNRNFPTFWGYDNEGSSSDPSSAVYRGPAPASEPETRALDDLVRRIKPKFLVSYHSAAELLLYGVGYQVATPTPDDVILAALAGDDANPAVEGFDPDLSAELYTTNGETTEHMAAEYDVLAYTPELSECQTVAPDPIACASVFNFPDDEGLIQAEFEKNLPFALDIAFSAKNPFEPVSHLGNRAPDFVLDEFAVSHGDRQTVQATVSRQIRNPWLVYRVNGSKRIRLARTHEWEGGERYGGDFNAYYRQVRGKIKGLQPGDTVEYWFVGLLDRQRHSHSWGWKLAKSERTGFNVTDDPATVLVIADEDYDGFTPAQTLTEPQYLFYYTDALAANGVSHDVWDLDSQGAPHPLGVLSHYEAVIWYVGDNIITQDLEDRDVFFPNSEIGVSDVIQSTTIAVRDYLNEGGKLIKTGDRAGYFGQFVGSFGGMLYADNGAPEEPCTIENDIFGDCLLYSDDFHQYWLGDFGRVPFGDPVQVLGFDSPLEGVTLNINGGDSANNSLDAGQSIVTSSVLPPDRFPTFADSRSIADYASEGSPPFDPLTSPPFDPLTGEYYVGLLARNNQYNRFTRVIDLTGAPPAASASLSFATSYDIEGNYDFFVVEAHTVGAGDWTTLNDINGNTPPVPLLACSDGLWNVHPFIFDHYVAADCLSPGPTGAFHAFNGNSNGWVNASFDLSAFSGSQVEVSLTYISDVGVTNTGAFVDDVQVEIDGVTSLQGWELDQMPWTVAPPPTGSPASVIDWERSTGLIDTVLAAAVATEDTVYLPFGFDMVQ